MQFPLRAGMRHSLRYAGVHFNARACLHPRGQGGKRGFALPLLIHPPSAFSVIFPFWAPSSTGQLLPTWLSPCHFAHLAASLALALGKLCLLRPFVPLAAPCIRGIPRVPRASAATAKRWTLVGLAVRGMRREAVVVGEGSWMGSMGM